MGRGVAAGKIRNRQLVRQLEAMRAAKLAGFAFEDNKAWRQNSPDWYTCIIPADMYLDPTVLEAIHAFDPGAIAFVRKAWWVSPEGKCVLAQHWCIGRHVKTPKRGGLLEYVEMPSGVTHPAPNVLEWVHEARDPRNPRPPGFLPFDGWLVEFLRANYRETVDVVRELRERLQRSREEKARTKRAFYDELAYQEHHMNTLIDPWLKKLGIDDWQAVYRNPKPVKPFVHFGGK